MFNNLKQERKHLIIVKQYHKTDFNLILGKGKKIRKEVTSKEGRSSFSGIELHRLFLNFFFLCNFFVLPCWLIPL